MGHELLPLLLGLTQWEGLAQAGGPPVIVEHVECGAPGRVEVRCAAGHGPLTVAETRLHRGRVQSARNPQGNYRRQSKPNPRRPLKLARH
jgi:hypothetical protein